VEEARSKASSKQAEADAAFHVYNLEPLLNYSGKGNYGGRRVYELKIDVKNVGSEYVTDFEIRIHFPSAFLDHHTGSEDRTKSTPTHVCITANAQNRAPTGLYPGDQLKNPLTIEYFIDRDNDRLAAQSEIFVDLFSRSMTPKRLTKPIDELRFTREWEMPF
jgi:hypothetical protein